MPMLKRALLLLQKDKRTLAFCNNRQPKNRVLPPRNSPLLVTPKCLARSPGLDLAARQRLPCIKVLLSATSPRKPLKPVRTWQLLPIPQRSQSKASLRLSMHRIPKSNRRRQLNLPRHPDADRQLRNISSPLASDGTHSNSRTTTIHPPLKTYGFANSASMNVSLAPLLGR